MDTGDIVFALMIISVVAISVALLTIRTYDITINFPVAADEAQNICIERGFDNYEDFDRTWFSQKALGVTCRYESRYIIDRDGNILVDARSMG